jgi:hypothetical protein
MKALFVALKTKTIIFRFPPTAESVLSAQAELSLNDRLQSNMEFLLYEGNINTIWDMAATLDVCRVEFKESAESIRGSAKEIQDEFLEYKRQQWVLQREQRKARANLLHVVDTGV